jgi:hypothetical protein
MMFEILYFGETTVDAPEKGSKDISSLCITIILATIGPLLAVETPQSSYSEARIGAPLARDLVLAPDGPPTEKKQT